MDAVRIWRWAVLLTPAMWKNIDGETQAVTLDEAASLFPKVLNVQMRETKLIAVDYSLWKEKILNRQQTKETHNENIS
ncbi:hypothetical protein L0337_35290 [candidate division KSB1 bacterium]|nr:hypothetical protein [candidate division KSB1 bacterium]